MTASIIPFTNHRGSSSHAVTAAGEGVTPPTLSPAPSHPRCYSVADGEPGLLIAMRDGRAKPFSPLECDAPTGSSTIFTPSFIQGGPSRRTEGRSPTDRLNRDIDGMAMFSPWTVSQEHWWRA